MDNITVKCNNVPRPLVAYFDLPINVSSQFDYVPSSHMDDESNDDLYHPRFFEYRGSWYDSHEFEVSPSHIMLHGFNAWQAQSYFSAVGVRWFDHEGDLIDGGDSVVVGYMHW